MKKKLVCALAAVVGLIATAEAGLIVDGTRDAAYLPALVVQAVNTQFGDAVPPFALVGSELDAGYGVVKAGRLYILLTGNLEPNFNKLEVFIDSVAGGENTLSALPEYDYFDGGAGHWISSRLGGMVFDTAFECDYHMFARWGGGGTPGPFEVDIVNRLGGGSAEVPGSAGIGGPTVDLVSIGVIPGGAAGQAGYSDSPALTEPLEFAINDNNQFGVFGGDDACDQEAAAAVTTGMEFSIALADLGNPEPCSVIRIAAMVNGSNHDYLSNQCLGPYAPPQGNLGGDGAGNYLGNLSGINFNNFAGDQYFSVYVPIPGDVDHDCDVDQSDLGALLTAFGKCEGDPEYDPDADFDGDGCVGQSDLGVLLANYGA